MASVSWALQVAIYQTLNGVISCPVYDAVPQDADYPYVVIGQHASNNRDFYTEPLKQHILTLSVFSAYSGKKEVLDIIEQVYVLLHRQKLALDSGVLVNLIVESNDATQDIDEQTYMGRITLSAFTQR